MKTNEKILNTLDNLNLTRVDLGFLAKLMDAWNVEHDLSTNDMYALSRFCHSIDDRIKECEEDIRSLLEKK